MNIQDTALQYGWQHLAGPSEGDAAGCYIGDLLGWVLSHLKTGDLWLTVMGNKNAVAIAVLRQASGILLVDNAPLDADAKKQADAKGIPIYGTPLSAFKAAEQIAAKF